MMYQFDLPWDFETFQTQVQRVVERFPFSPWPNESWYSQIVLSSNDYASCMPSGPGLELSSYLTCWGLPLLKARISKTQSAGVWPGDRGWHVDEPMSQGVRIFIPVFDSNDSGIEMEDAPPESTPLGYGYTWNTSKPHRIWCKSGVAMQRIAVIIALKPDKTRNAKQWAKYFQSFSNI
jgi:hypothetical protein